ncbi:MAG: hypothetical protein LBJ73_01730 [Rickettsiales bacterium]|jgi:hypothetical protein|nr:hypothetical protein [Rickettsiales bacterium]
MKKLLTLLMFCALCSALFVPFGAVADDASDIARAARRPASNVVSATTSRQKPDVTATPVSGGTARPAGGGVSATARGSGTARDGVVVQTEKSRAAQVTVPAQSVTSRSGAVQSRAAVGQRVSGRALGAARTAVAQPVVQSAAAPARTVVPAAAPRTASVARAAVPKSTARSAANMSVARAAVNPDAAAAIAATDYKKCREIFYSCMDEFCAAKDTQLKRCACSSRIRDFDNIKNRMTNVEDKILTFNERLLTVNMDKEDAAAISVATEGETAYQKTDKSASKKILDEIAKKLKSSTADTDLGRNLSAISLSLDADSAFDNIDSMMGASTATKEGAALYNAALPICREMVAEVCDDQGASIAESGYMMAVEQDCNTVSKAYSTMQDQALEKVREGGALLDMARLDIHQQRNADDILTCKKKMLDALSNSSVCGTNLGKCLDTTGKYIDPSTGQAFLTVNLADLSGLITRPTGDQKWTSVSNNKAFVTFLDSKKKYLEPAMDSCQDISDRVWTEFIEDALSQIKLAQDQKLEEMRQSCTSLTTQCLSASAKSISEFDARALSVFGVQADKTVNEMCSGIKVACTALLETTSGDQDWVGGMTEIETDKTYDTIIKTCREIGKACIIQVCKSISGNFGLCEDIDKSINRKSVINRDACWKEVVQCVQSAGNDSIAEIMKKFNKNVTNNSADNFYEENYKSNKSISVTNNDIISCIPNNNSCVYDICAVDGTNNATCRLAEKIWGNCEFKPSKLLNNEDDQNYIKIPSDTSVETLLSWFAINTGTSLRPDSCKDTSCAAGLIPISGKCVSSTRVTSDTVECDVNDQIIVEDRSNPKWTNCCKFKNASGGFDKGELDYNGNCCEKTEVLTGYDKLVTESYWNEKGNMQENAKLKVCRQNAAGVKFMAMYFTGTDQNKIKHVLFCRGTLTATALNDDSYPDGQTLNCDGNYVVINEATGAYVNPDYVSSENGLSEPEVYSYNYYNLDSENSVISCVYDSNSWSGFNSSNISRISNVNCNKVLDVDPNTFNNGNNNMFIMFGPLLSTPSP